MGIYEINIAREKLTQLPADTVLGLEGRDSLNFMTVGFSNFVTDVVEKFISNKLIAPFITDNQTNSAMRKLEKVPYSTMDKFTIRTPEGVTGPMVPYLTTLLEATVDLADIKDRLLDPLKMWSGKAIANPGFIEKVWFDRNLRFVDVDKHLEALSKHYDDKVGDDISFAPMHEIYPRSLDFQIAGELIQKLSKQSAVILGLDIPRLTAEIAANVNRLIDANDKNDYMQKAPNQAIAKLSESLYATAREVELLSIILFQIRVSAVAYEESVKKLTEKL